MCIRDRKTSLSTNLTDLGYSVEYITRSAFVVDVSCQKHPKSSEELGDDCVLPIVKAHTKFGSHEKLSYNVYTLPCMTIFYLFTFNHGIQINENFVIINQ